MRSILQTGIINGECLICLSLNKSASMTSSSSNPFWLRTWYSSVFYAIPALLACSRKSSPCILTMVLYLSSHVCGFKLNSWSNDSLFILSGIPCLKACLYYLWVLKDFKSLSSKFFSSTVYRKYQYKWS